MVRQEPIPANWWIQVAARQENQWIGFGINTRRHQKGVDIGSRSGIPRGAS